MSRFYTQTGDDGYTSLLGEGRVAKYSLRTEAVGTLDEAVAALGIARSQCIDPHTAPLLLVVQRDLYNLMAEVASTPENAVQFRKINDERVSWLEEQTDRLSEVVSIPEEFIVPGDSPSEAALDLARTIVRRAERRVVQLFHTHQIENQELMRYLNRLSSLCFVLELLENQASGHQRPTLAKGSAQS